MFTSLSLNSPTVILHVENDADDVFLMLRALRKGGVTNPVSSVENGKEAIAYLTGAGKYGNRQDYPMPAVILLDWNMPLMSGPEFLNWLRAQNVLKRIPVVVLTSSTNPQDMIEAYERGANGFVVKPANQQSLLEMAQAFAHYWLRWNRNEAAVESV